MSIVMPTYNRIDYVSEAIESALAQTYGDFELIISDNGMSVAVEELAASYGDPRIRYRHNGGNIGAMRNAVAGYTDARGTYIATLHDDDAWEPTFLEVLVPPLEADPSLTLAFSDHFIMRTDGRVDMAKTEDNTRVWRRTPLQPGVHRPFTRLALVDRAVPAAMAAVFRKSAVDWTDFPDEIEVVYDLWVAYQTSRGGGGAFYSDQRLTRYRHHGGAMTSHSRYDRAFVYCYDRFLADPALADLAKELRRESGAFRTGLGLALLAEDERGEARRHLLRGLALRPQLRAAVGLALSLSPVSVSKAPAWGRRAPALGRGSSRRF